MSPAVLGFFGGSALLVYSMGELSRSIQYLAGPKFRNWLNNFTENKFTGMTLGFVLSICLSSSGAVMVMLVGLADARLLKMEQVFTVILGASIGSTFIVHLIAFRISEWGLLLILLGVIAESLFRPDWIVRSARILLFLGLMFFSLNLVVESGKQLESNEFFRYTVQYFHARPVVSMCIAAALAALVQSSAATIAFVMSLMAAKNGSLVEALPWVLGANLGTTTTAFFASLSAGIPGKQAALGNLFVKVTGVVLCLPFLPFIATSIDRIGLDVVRGIAVAHTLFNVLLAVLFFPFLKIGVKIVASIIPDNRNGGPFILQYLDSNMLATPELALAQSQREILRLSDTVERMLETSLQLFRRGNQREIDAVRDMDKLIDFLNKNIRLFLTKLSQKEMTPEQAQKELELLLRTTDLENIGDIVDKNILSLVKKVRNKGYSFSEEGWAEIGGFHQKVMDCLRLSTAYFNSREPALRTQLLSAYSRIEAMTLDLSELHLHRLHRGVKESLESSSVHLDMLGHLHRIAALSINFTRLQTQRGEESAAAHSVHWKP